MVTLMNELFAIRSIDNNFFYTQLIKNPLIYLNYMRSHETFYVDTIGPQRVDHIILKDFMMPDNPENWLRAVHQLVERVHAEW